MSTFNISKYKDISPDLNLYYSTRNFLVLNKLNNSEEWLRGITRSITGTKIEPTSNKNFRGALRDNTENQFLKSLPFFYNRRKLLLKRHGN